MASLHQDAQLVARQHPLNAENNRIPNGSRVGPIPVFRISNCRSLFFALMLSWASTPPKYEGRATAEHIKPAFDRMHQRYVWMEGRCVGWFMCFSKTTVLAEVETNVQMPFTQFCQMIWQVLWNWVQIQSSRVRVPGFHPPIYDERGHSFWESYQKENGHLWITKTMKLFPQRRFEGLALSTPPYVTKVSW